MCGMVMTQYENIIELFCENNHKFIMNFKQCTVHIKEMQYFTLGRCLYLLYAIITIIKSIVY